MADIIVPPTRRQFRERQLRHEFSQLPKETQEINGYWAWAVGQVTDELHAVMAGEFCTAIHATGLHSGEVIYCNQDHAYERSKIPMVESPEVARLSAIVERHARAKGWNVAKHFISDGLHYKDRRLTFVLVRAEQGGLM